MKMGGKILKNLQTGVPYYLVLKIKAQWYRIHCFEKYMT